MDEELRALLDRNLEIGKENNRILRRLQSHMRWSKAVSIFYWVIILGSALGAYYFIQPYVDELRNIYGDLIGLGQSNKSVESFLFKGLEGSTTYEGPTR